MRVRRTSRVLAAALSLAVGGSLAVASATPATAAPKAVAAPADYFGMHVLNAGASSNAPSRKTVGALRLWDTGTTWADVQPAPGTWNWARMDAAVNQARRAGQKPLIVFGQTPAWASSNPTLDTGKGLPVGSTVKPRNLVLWRAYVTAVVKRYSAKGVTDFQTWNEPNGGLFFTGTPQEMAALNLAAYQVVHKGVVVKKKVKGKTVRSIKRTFPKAKLVGPGFTTRRAPAVTWMSKYLATAGGNKMDVVGLHLYSNPGKGPEDTVLQLAKAKKYLKKAKLAAAPIWVTEVSFGGAVGGSQNRPEVISEANQAAYVARFLLLARANGIARTYWYAWDAHGVLGVELTKADNRTLTSAGKAYGVTRGWMSKPLVGCLRAATGVYTCTIQQGRGKGLVVWHPTKKVSIKAPAGTTSVTSVLGKRAAKKAKAKIVVTSSPQLISTSR